MNGRRARSPDFGPRFTAPILLGPALNPINTTMISVALIPIADATGSSAAQVALLVAGLYLASAIAQPVMGRLVDLHGPKRLYLAGMAVTAVAGVVPLLWPTFGAALTSRIVIGIGTSAAYPAAVASIRAQAARTGREPPRSLFSALSVSSLVSAAVGPVLGGALVAQFGWQAIFAVNAPYALLAMILALVWLPSDRGRRAAPQARPEGRSRLDPFGMALFAVGIGAAVAYALGLWPGQHWLIGVAAGAIVFLALWERHHPAPFVDLRMLTSRPALVRTYARMFLVYACMYVVVYGLTQWLQAGAGYTADEAGWMQLPAVVLAGAAAAIVARARSIRAAMIAAAAIPAAGGLLITVLDGTTPLWLLIGALALFGPPQGLSAFSNQVAVYAQSPPEQTGAAAGLSRTSVQLGAIAASALIGAVYGQTPTAAGLHVLGWVVAALGSAALLLTWLDPALRRLGTPDDRSPGQ